MSRRGKRQLNDGNEGVRPIQAEPGLSFTGRVASWSARHRWWVAAGAFAVVLMAVFVLRSVEAEIRDDGGGSGESGKADALFDERFRPEVEQPLEGAPPPTRTEGLIFSSQLVEVDDAGFQSAVEAAITDLRKLP